MAFSWGQIFTVSSRVNGNFNHETNVFASATSDFTDKSRLVRGPKRSFIMTSKNLVFQDIMFFRRTLGTTNSSTLLNFSQMENPVKRLKYFFSLSLPCARSLKTVTENLCSQGISKFDWMERETKFSLEVLSYSPSPLDAVSVNSDSRTALPFQSFFSFLAMTSQVVLLSS